MSNSGPFFSSTLIWTGTRANQPPNMLFLTGRDPGPYDTEQQSLGNLCLREDTQTYFYLGSLAGNSTSNGIIANWIPFTSGATGPTALKAADTNIAYPVAGLVDVIGGPRILTTADNVNTLTISINPDGSNGQVLTLVSGIPVWANAGASTATYLVDDDDNPAYPTVGGAIGLIGRTSQIVTIAGENEITIGIPNLTTGLVYTNVSAISTLTNGTIGYFLKINGSGVPQWLPGGGGGSGTVTSVTAGTNLNNTDDITTPDPVINLDTSILQPFTTADGSAGVYALGVTSYTIDSFLHGYGVVAGRNTFVGRQAGNLSLSNVSSGNTGAGYRSLNLITDGNDNAALGYQSLDRLLDGENNVSIGYQSGHNYTGSESNNITLGAGVAGTTGESNVLRLGQDGTGSSQQSSAYIGGVYNVTPPTNAARIVTVNSNYQLQTVATGTSGYVMTQGASGPTWAPGGGGGGGGTLTTCYTVGSYTWSKNINTKMVLIISWNGGSGGGAGSSNVNGYWTSANGGGGGGWGGGTYYSVPASFFSGSEPVEVGAGGLGGTPSSMSNANGGFEGGNTSVGSIGCPLLHQWSQSTQYPLPPTGGGSGGNAPIAAQWSLGNVVVTNSLTLNTGTFTPPTSASFSVGKGINLGANTSVGDVGLMGFVEMICAAGGGNGGGGGGYPATRGGDVLNRLNFNYPTAVFAGIAGGVAGVGSGGNGSDGSPSLVPGPTIVPAIPLHGFLCGGSGGGGGEFNTGSGAGGNGGKGAFPGAGGGGGAASSAGAGGNGGAGGDGYLIIIEQM